MLVVNLHSFDTIIRNFYFLQLAGPWYLSMGGDDFMARSGIALALQYRL